MEAKFLQEFKTALELNSEVTMDDIFRDYAEWDSMSHMSLIAMLDAEFNVQIENAIFDKLKTVGDLYKYVADRSLK